MLWASLLSGSARVSQPRSVTGCLPALAVPPSIENEDLEEVVKVPEGQTANLTCNATGKATRPHGGLGKGEKAAVKKGDLEILPAYPGPLLRIPALTALIHGGL